MTFFFYKRRLNSTQVAVGHVFFDNGKHFFHFFFALPGYSAADKVAAINEILQKIAFGSLYKTGGFFHAFDSVELFRDGGAELVIDDAGQQKVYRFVDGRHIEAFQPYRFGVFFGRIFDIHGDVIDKVLRNQLFSQRGIGSVRVELNLKAESLYF